MVKIMGQGGKIRPRSCGKMARPCGKILSKIARLCVCVCGWGGGGGGELTAITLGVLTLARNLGGGGGGGGTYF